MMNVNQGTIDIDTVHLQINMCTNRYPVLKKNYWYWVPYCVTCVHMFVTQSHNTQRATAKQKNSSQAA